MKRLLLIVACLFSLLSFTGCSSASSSLKPKILVTIPPYAGLVRPLVDNHIDVEIVVPLGSNPHTYEPSPDQMKRFIQAKVWFRTGDEAEDKMAEFLKQHPVEIVDIVSEYATLGATHADECHTCHHQGTRLGAGKDLHVWLSPQIGIYQVDKMVAVLVTHFPDLKSIIQQNSLLLKHRLAELDRKLSSQLYPFKGSNLLVSHPALGYYCERYHLHQLSIEIEGKDPLPQDIAALMAQLKAHPVPVVLIEPQYNKKGAVLIAEKLHVPYEEINPYAEDYFAMLNHITSTILKYYGHSS